MYIGEKNIFYFFTLLQFVVVATWVFWYKIIQIEF
jgi:hypothetical protein